MSVENELFSLESAAYITRAFFAIFSIFFTLIVIFIGCCFRTACKGKVFLTYTIAICDFIIAIFWCLIAIIGGTFSFHKNSSFDATIVALTITITVTALKFMSYLLVTTYCINSALKVREIYTNHGREMGAGDRRKKYRQSRIRIWLTFSVGLPFIYGVVWIVLSIASFHDFAHYNSDIKSYNISPGIFGYVISIEERPLHFDWDYLWIDLQILSIVLINIFLLIMIVSNAIIYVYIAKHIAKNRGLYLLDKHDYKLACILALAKTTFIVLEEVTILMATIVYFICLDNFTSHKFSSENDEYILFIILLISLSVIQGLQGTIHVLLYGIFKPGFMNAIRTYHRSINYIREPVTIANTRQISQESDRLVNSRN